MDPFVAKHLRGVSRTYALLVPMLPRGLSDTVGLAYLLMRVVDTLEDAACISDVERRTHLSALDAALSGDAFVLARPFPAQLGESSAETELMGCANDVLARVSQLAEPARQAVLHCARTMIRGVLLLLERSASRRRAYPAIADSAELREYCYYVAGVVGEMLCALFAAHLRMPARQQLRELAVELGVGLQLVNILKDALKDAGQGRRYLPRAEGGGVSHAEIYKAVLGEARRSLQCGVEFVMALPPSAGAVRSFCGLPIAWGAMTLARAERRADTAKIGRGAIRSSIALFGRIAGDDSALRAWFTKMLRAPQPA